MEAERLRRLEAIESRLQDYDHHSLQASFDLSDGAICPLYYEDSGDESRMAEEALNEAVLMSRGITPERAVVVRKEWDND